MKPQTQNFKLQVIRVILYDYWIMQKMPDKYFEKIVIMATDSCCAIKSFTLNVYYCVMIFIKRFLITKFGTNIMLPKYGIPLII